jgi:hypothetical protein
MDAQPAKEFPDSLDGIEFRAVWGKVVKIQTLRTARGVMIASVVSNQDRTAATIPMTSQVLQEGREAIGIEG